MQKKKALLSVCGGLVPGTPQIPESAEGPVPESKWCSTRKAS